MANRPTGPEVRASLGSTQSPFYFCFPVGRSPYSLEEHVTLLIKTLRNYNHTQNKIQTPYHNPQGSTRPHPGHLCPAHPALNPWSWLPLTFRSLYLLLPLPGTLLVPQTPMGLAPLFKQVSAQMTVTERPSQPTKSKNISAPLPSLSSPFPQFILVIGLTTF